MSTPDDDRGLQEPLDRELKGYVRALRAIDRPSVRTRAKNLAAVRAQIVPSRRRFAIVAAVVATAAVLALGWSLQAREAIRDDDSRERLQSPYGRDDPTTGAEVARVPVPIHTESLHPDRNIDAPAVDLDAIDPDPPDTDDPIGPTSPDRTPAGGAEARPARRGAPTPEAPSSLAEELVRFNPVREALNAEKPLQALAALDAYDRAFPSGTFRAESQLSRVTALCQLGRGDEAQRLRDDFVRRHPGSHLAPRMREVCPDAP